MFVRIFVTGRQLDRQRHAHQRTADARFSERRVFEYKRAGMLFDDFLHDRQAEAGAF